MLPVASRLGRVRSPETFTSFFSSDNYTRTLTLGLRLVFQMFRKLTS